MAKIHQPTARNLAHLARLLRQGELVAIPTETVYGLAANALDAKACAKIFRVKGRPRRDPLIVHVGHIKQVDGLAEFNETAWHLARTFWPGPLTLIAPKKPVVPDIVTAGLKTVAVRIPAHEDALWLLHKARVPLAAPSANPFGYISPTEARHVEENLGRRIGHILDGGPCEHGIESTVVDVSDAKRCVILRAGAVTGAQLRAALRGRKVQVVAARKRAGGGKAGLRAPGLLARHYSPRTPLRLSRNLNPKIKTENGIGRIFFRKPGHPTSAAHDTDHPKRLRRDQRSRPATATSGANDWWLSARGSLAEAARNLYAVLRESDARGLKRIMAELAPAGTEGSLAEAINDRLRRAAARG
jgi:L-threonylcarbamoyladenylate synthase